MSAFVSGITDTGSMPALVKSLSFHEAKLQVIAENVANFSTPGYRAKRLDHDRFQAALGEALERRRVEGSGPLRMPDTEQFRTGDAGRLEFTPTERPIENLLSYDGTNLSIEKQMSELAKTGSWHELTARLLSNKYNGLRKAIRGTV